MKLSLGLFLLLLAAILLAQAPVIPVSESVTGDRDAGYNVVVTNTAKQPITCIFWRQGTGNFFRVSLDRELLIRDIPEKATLYAPLPPGASITQSIPGPDKPRVVAVILLDGTVVGSAIQDDGEDYVADIFAARRIRAQRISHWLKLAESLPLMDFLREALVPLPQMSSGTAQELAPFLADADVRFVAQLLSERIEYMGADPETERQQFLERLRIHAAATLRNSHRRGA